MNEPRQTLYDSNGPHRPQSSAHVYWCIFGLFVLGCAAMWIDVPVARWFGGERLPGDLRELLHLSEAFAHGFGIAFILITVAVLDREKLWKYPRVICMVVCAGMACNLLKLMVERSRPRNADLSLSVFDSFVGIAPIFSSDSTGQSFPSAHSASAVALAIALTWLYPRGRYLWAILALLASLQRIDTLAHFVSDTVWGLAVGMLISLGILHGWLSNPWLNRWEKHLFNRHQTAARAMLMNQLTKSAPAPQTIRRHVASSKAASDPAKAA